MKFQIEELIKQMEKERTPLYHTTWEDCIKMLRAMGPKVLAELEEERLMQIEERRYS